MGMHGLRIFTTKLLRKLPKRAFCKAHAQSSDKRCTKKAIWGTKYCWQHESKIFVLISIVFIVCSVIWGSFFKEHFFPSAELVLGFAVALRTPFQSGNFCCKGQKEEQSPVNRPQVPCCHRRGTGTTVFVRYPCPGGSSPLLLLKDRCRLWVAFAIKPSIVNFGNFTR
jgi:hypothetical protein